MTGPRKDRSGRIVAREEIPDRRERGERRERGRSRLGSAFVLALICVAVFAPFLFVSNAKAVLIAGPDGSIDTTPPSPDPGFANVGNRLGLTGVYVRNGWVLTANHVGLGPITLDGISYDPVPGSSFRFTTSGTVLADLIAFKLKLRPPLPDLVLATAPPTLNEPLIMIGNGLSRGAATTWSGLDGWNIVSPGALRWGTNTIDILNQLALNTQAFGATFTVLRGSSRNDPEAQAVVGDSGGAAFVFNGGSAELVGILYAESVYNGQPSGTAIFGNQSLMVDLDFYRSQIVAVIDQPDCSDGLDEDGDGLVDFPADPGCSDALDADEQSTLLVCDNGLDDDLDGLIDYPADPGCDSSLDPSEVPEPNLALSVLAGTMALALFARRRQIESEGLGHARG